MIKKRKQYSPEFKAKVALTTLRNEESTAELAAKYEVHPTMITNWKRELVEGRLTGLGCARLRCSVKKRFTGD